MNEAMRACITIILDLGIPAKQLSHATGIHVEVIYKAAKRLTPETIARLKTMGVQICPKTPLSGKKARG